MSVTPSPTRGAARWVSRGVPAADQVFSSLSNVLAVVLVAHILDADDFGRFSFSYAVVIAALGVSRAWFGTRLSLVHDPADVLDEARRTTGTLVLIAPLLACAVLAAGAAVGGGSGSALLVVALAAPVICLQDALRFAAVAADRPTAALVSDGLWALCLMALLPVSGTLTGDIVLWMWFGAAVAAMLVLFLGLRVRPVLRGGWGRLRERHPTSASASAGAVVTMGASLVVIGVVSAVLSDSAAGSLRGASTILGPLNVVMAFVNLACTPTLVRRSRDGDLRYCVLIAMAMLAIVVAWGIVVLSLPTPWGEFILGDSWPGTREVLPFTLLEYCTLGVATAWALGLKVRAEAWMLWRQRAVLAVLTLVIGCGAVLLGDVRAVSAALALASAVSMVVGWRDLLHSVAAARTADHPFGVVVAPTGSTVP